MKLSISANINITKAYFRTLYLGGGYVSQSGIRIIRTNGKISGDPIFNTMRICLLFTVFFFSVQISFSQSSMQWPKEISYNGTTIKIYQPQIDSYQGNIVKTRGAFSILENGKTDPVFGALWTTSQLQTDRVKRTAALTSIKVDQVKFAGDTNQQNVAQLKMMLEKEIPKWGIVVSMDQLEASMEAGGDQTPGATDLSTTPPKIIYTDKPSTLVLIDGEPKTKENKEMGVDMVLNTAFTIAQINAVYYLNGSKKWYTSKNINGPWTYTKSIPKQLDKLNKAILENDKKEDTKEEAPATDVIPEIIVSTDPAELIQSNGTADFASIKGTGLLFMTNTNNDVFMNTSENQYYVLLSGRWYTSSSLKGPWTFRPSDKLPADFAKIPTDSDKANVLASVAGTPQAMDAVMDAEIPQTAKVDRKTATTTVKYDGEPKFVAVSGTTLQYAVNTSSTVLLSNKVYYCVDNGIWFQSVTPKGPWTVSTTRPDDVSKIPATVPVYNVKYVYIYETTPQFVYVGYTPGYMGAYVYGGTVFYGTGFYYNPWYGPYYYPRPVTYGFSMHYNPYYGWSMGFHYSSGWMHYSYYGGHYHGGYWGPPMYRPPYYHHPGYPPHYRPPYYPKPGYPGPRPTPYPTTRPANNINANIYRNANGVTANNTPRPMPAATPSARPSTGAVNNGGPSTMPATRPSNNIQTDKQGNVFKQNGNGWQERSGNNWQNMNQNRQPEVNRLNQQQQNMNRGNQRTAPASRPTGGSAPAGRRR
jgi:hypothetical protein